jgi:hypothetical protein
MEHALKMLQIEREQARLGNRPDGEEVPWGSRAVHTAQYEEHQRELPQKGLRVKISLFISGNNAFPGYALIGLTIVPLEAIMTFRAPYLGTPWHISVGFSNEDGSLSREASAFIEKFLTPQEVHLKIKNVAWNAVAYLADDDSITSDPVVKSFHQSSHYSQKPLHITF